MKSSPPSISDDSSSAKTSARVKSWLRRIADEPQNINIAKQVVRHGAYVGSKIESYTVLPRAMDQARSQIQKAAESGQSYRSGSTILATQMSLARGRFSRDWHAPEGGIWGCLVVVNTLLPESSRFIPFAAGLACCETLRQLGCEDAKLRWVNDVLHDDKKVAGFLVESFHEPVSKEEYILVGFGINVNNMEFPAELASTATCVQKILGQRVDTSEVTAQFLARLAWYIGVLHYEENKAMSGEGFSGINGKHLLLQKWLDNSDTVGQRVWYGFDVMTQPQYTGQVEAVDDDGGLVLRLADGHEKIEYSGEIRYIR